jgi:hypothetical protein
MWLAGGGAGGRCNGGQAGMVWSVAPQQHDPVSLSILALPLTPLSLALFLDLHLCTLFLTPLLWSSYSFALSLSPCLLSFCLCVSLSSLLPSVRSQMIQAIQVLRFHLLELEKVRASCLPHPASHPLSLCTPAPAPGWPPQYPGAPSGPRPVRQLLSPLHHLPQGKNAH